MSVAALARRTGFARSDGRDCRPAKSAAHFWRYICGASALGKPESIASSIANLVAERAAAFCRLLSTSKFLRRVNRA
jgi:hypothetical protein